MPEETQEETQEDESPKLVKTKLIAELKHAHDAGVPFVAVETADQPAVIRALKESRLTSKLQSGEVQEIPFVAWDAMRGPYGVNATGRGACAMMLDNKAPLALSQLPDALDAARLLPEDSFLLVCNGHLCMPNLIPIQAIANLRNQFKRNNRVLVLLGPAFVIPPELVNDTLILDDPLPTEDDIRELVKGFCDEKKGNNVKYTEKVLDRAVEALRGLSEFAAEQALALSIVQNETKKEKERVIDIERLWQRKRKLINATPGLSVEKPGEKFDQIGGLGQIKIFAERYFNGPRRPRVVVLIDEIDKAMAGAGQNGLGDNTGTSQDQHALLLKNMEDYDYNGFLPVGAAGAGKTLIARAIAATFDVPCIAFDMAGMKSSLLGSSEQRARAALKMINAIAGDGGAFFIGTCNGLEELSPALRRRFRCGIWFFDLPEARQREEIGAIQVKRYGLKMKDNELAFWASCKDWSGANIRDCCEMAYALNISIKDAANYIVPAGEQDQTIKSLRTLADLKFLDAESLGKYESRDRLLTEKKEASGNRRLKG